MNPSPLRYPGGKYKLYKYVSELVKENKCTTYIEPFCGGAAIALELLFEGIVKDVIINDYDYTIFCFWNSILHETDEFVQLILDTQITMDEWHKQKAVRNELDTHSSLEIGFSTFFLNRTNRSGIIDKAGPIGGLSQQGDYPIDCRFNKVRLISQIQKIAEYKDHIMIYNMEALDFIEDIILKKRKSFVFFDPPYYTQGKNLYLSFVNKDEHKKLAQNILNLSDYKWITTYDIEEEILKLYHPYVKTYTYRLNYSANKKRKAKEYIFINNNTKAESFEKVKLDRV